MKTTLTLPESDILALDTAAKKHGTVELAKLIGVGKTQLYRILRGHNRVTPATADKISAWLSIDAPKPEQPQKKRPSQSRNLAISQSETKSRNLADRPTPPTRPTKSELIAALHDPEFQKIAVVQLCKAILKSTSIAFGGSCKCGD